MNKFQAHFEDFQNSNDFEISIQSYSGRNMYGKECLAIVGEHSACLKAIAHAINLAHNEIMDDIDLEFDFETYVNSMLSYRQDNMGRSDVVLYWPRIKYEENSERWESFGWKVVEGENF